jgi:hypothetical protein
LAQHVNRYPFAFPNQPQEQMFSSDIVMAQPPSFVDRQLDDSFGTGGKSRLSIRRARATPYHAFNSPTHLFSRDAEIVQDPHGNAALLGHQAEEKVLGTDVPVIQIAGLFLSPREHPARPFRETIEIVRHLPIPLPL